MRNLKKILALVLALVMSMSLVTIANAADFSDSNDISYEEAVDVMSTIGVINGMDDGSFDPHGTLTREQAAKLVTYMLLGDNAERLGIERSTFDDVAMTRWSAPAIEYCVSLGIIDGAGDGNFYPAGQLTGAAFAKVLLTAIGYDSQKEGLVGSAWSVNVSALAAEVGLDNGIEDLSWSAPITREEAAQMALNAIQAPLVAYDNDATITVNGAEVSIGSGDAYYVTTTLAREQRIDDRQLSNSDDYTVEFGEKYFPRLRLVRETDDFERPSHTWVYENTELGTYVDYDLLTETYTEAVTGRQLYELLGKSTIDKYGLTYYVDGVVNTTIDAKNMIRGNNVEYKTTGNGVLTQVFVDHDEEEIIITSINTWLAQANADYNESSETASLKVFEKNDTTGTTKIVDVDDVPNIVDLAADQFVLVNMSGKNTGSAANLEVVKVSDVEIIADADVTKFSTSSSNVVSKLTADGEEYSASQMAFYDKEVLNKYDEQLLTDMTYNVYLDQYGYVIGVDLFEGTLNYVFITGYDRGRSHISIKTAQAGAIFLDGSMEEITVNVTNTNKNIDRLPANSASIDSDRYFTRWRDVGEVAENNWYTYTESNGVYTLRPATRSFASIVSNNTVIKSDYVFLDDNGVAGGSYERAYGNDDSIYITVEPGTVDMSGGGTGVGKDAIIDVTGLYTGVQSVEIEITDAYREQVQHSAYTLYDSDNYIIASIVLGEAQGSVQNYAYILSGAKSEERKADGYYYWEFDAVVEGQKVTLQAKTEYNSVFYPLSKYHVQELRYDGEYVTDITSIENSNIYTERFRPISGQDIYDVGHVVNTGLLHDEHAACAQTASSRIDGTFTLVGRTLWTNRGNGDVGLTFAAEDTPVVLVQKQGTASNLEPKTINTTLNAVEGLLADANAATDGTQFKGRIVAVLNSQGVAQWAVIISDTPMIIGGGSVPSGSGLVPVTYNGTTAPNYTLRYYKTAYDRSQVESLLESYFGQGVTVTAYSASNGAFYLDSMPLFPMTYNQQEVVDIRLDGNHVAYADKGNTYNMSVSAGHYLVNESVWAASIDSTTTGNVITLGAAVTANDVDVFTVYSITTAAGITVDSVDFRGDKATQPVSSTWWYAKGTTVTLNGGSGATYRQFAEGTSVIGGYYAGGQTATMSYQVTKPAVTINLTTGYLVQVDGVNQGVYASGTVYFEAPVAGAKYAAASKSGVVDADGKATSTVTLTNTNKTHAYAVAGGDADSNGVINLVQVVKIDAFSGGTTATYNDTVSSPANPAASISAGDYFKVGTTITLNATVPAGRHIQVNGVDVGPEGTGTAVSTTYILKNTDTALTISVG